MPHTHLHRTPERGQRVRLLGARRRQIVAQHFAARIERIGIEDQRTVAIIDPGPAAGRLDQTFQNRCRALGVDGEAERAGERVVAAIGLTGFDFKQLLGIELHLVGVDAGGIGQRARDDLALRQQALHFGVDQSGAELIEIENAGNKDQEADQIEDDDPPGQAGEAVAKGQMQHQPPPGDARPRPRRS